MRRSRRAAAPRAPDPASRRRRSQPAACSVLKLAMLVAASRRTPTVYSKGSEEGLKLFAC